MKEKAVRWIGMGVRKSWTSSVCLYQRIYRNNNNSKKLNLGRVSFRAGHNRTKGNRRPSGTGFGPKRREKASLLVVWASQEVTDCRVSAVSCGHWGHTSSSHSGFLPHISVPSRAKLRCLQGIRIWTHAPWLACGGTKKKKAGCATLDGLFVWQCLIQASTNLS